MNFGRAEVPKPKNGRRYRGMAVCRISTEHQDEMSLADQQALYRERLPQYLEGQYDLEIMSTRISGEILDRAEFIELSEIVEKGEYDFVICEDLGRIARRIQALILCEEGEDSATRIIAINDHVDTLETDRWRNNAFFATMKHESHNSDTSKRIKRSHRNRFLTGQMVRSLPAGYIKPHPGASEDECTKAPGAQEVYDEWFDRLDRGETFAEIARWLNEIDFPLGASVKKSRWDGTLVAQTTRQPILKGLREHNRRTAVRVNRTGRRKSISAPPDLLMQRPCARLAFIEPERYDRILRNIRRNNEKYRNGIAEAHGGRGRQRGTRLDSRWPSQHVRCGICGRKFVLGGHGRRDRMMCDGVRSYQCWNAMTVDCDELAKGVATEVFARIETLPDFDSQLFASVQQEAQELQDRLSVSLGQLRVDREKLLREIGHLTEALASGLSSPAVLARLRQAESGLRDIDDRIADEIERQPKPITIPTASQIRELADNAFSGLSVNDREFGHLMRKVISDFYILPYRLIDGGLISPRSTFRLNLAALDGISLPDGIDCTAIDCWVTLTKDPQRVAFRQQVIDLRREGHTEREAAERLGITHTAAQRAAALHRQMERMGIIDPWQPVRSDLEANDCYQRIHNPQYQFTPLENFEAKFPMTE